MENSKTTNMEPTHEWLTNNAIPVASAYEGTVIWFRCADGGEWIVMSDNSVISKEEDDSTSEPIFSERNKQDWHYF